MYQASVQSFQNITVYDLDTDEWLDGECNMRFDLSLRISACRVWTRTHSSWR